RTTQSTQRLRACFRVSSKVSIYGCRFSMSAALRFQLAVGRASLIWPFCIRKGFLPAREPFSMDSDFKQQGGPEPNEPGALTTERSARRSRTEPRYIPKVFTVSTWAIFHFP